MKFSVLENGRVLEYGNREELANDPGTHTLHICCRRVRGGM